MPDHLKGSSGLRRYCINCGALVEPDSRFCTRCGTAVVGVFPPPAPKPANIAISENMPQELKRFNWAAFIFSWIWALARGLYHWAIIILLLEVLGAVLFFMAPVFWGAVLVLDFVLGFKGNEFDWKNGHYQSVAEFRQSHRRWNIGLGVLVVAIFLSVFLIVLLVSTQS